MAWGSSSLRSCASLWERIERNDSSLTDLYILPTKSVTKVEWERFRLALALHGTQRCLQSIHASGHAIDVDSLISLSKAFYDTSLQVAWDEIALGDASLGDDGVVALVSAWSNDFRLASLDLSYKGLRHKGLQSLLQWALRSVHLKKLDLSRNTDLTKGLVAVDLGVAGKTCFPALQELNVAECNIEGDSGLVFLALLADIPNLRVLKLSHNRLSVSACDTLTSLPTSMVELSLLNCGLGDGCFKKIMHSLSKLDGLQILDLSQNAMTVIGATKVAQGLACGFANLQTLLLAGNPLQSAGVETLVKEGCQLRQSKNALKMLDLSSTQCDVEGARVAIQTSQAQELRLFGNALGSDGFGQLVDTLQGCHATLSLLDLGGNDANQDAVVKLLRALLLTEAGRDCNLKTIVVGGNQGGDALEELIQQIKSIHPGIDIARDRLQQKR